MSRQINKLHTKGAVVGCHTMLNTVKRALGYPLIGMMTALACVRFHSIAAQSHDESLLPALLE